MEQHDCYDGFWGHNGVVEALVLILDNMPFHPPGAHPGFGAALRMSRGTYHTLTALRNEIERAVNAPPPFPIPAYIGGVSPIPDADEADLRAAAQAVMAELVKDQYDSVVNGHATRMPSWLTNGTAEVSPNNAMLALTGGEGAPQIVGTEGLLFKVRNSLGC
jgi:hypothetical protein